MTSNPPKFAMRVSIAKTPREYWHPAPGVVSISRIVARVQSPGALMSAGLLFLKTSRYVIFVLELDSELDMASMPITCGEPSVNHSGMF